MKIKMNGGLVFLLIFLVAVGVFLLYSKLTFVGYVTNIANEVSENVAKCIGQNSILYVQSGCPHCEKQLELFGDNRKYLNIIDCIDSPEKCQNIIGVPTWIINGKQYSGVQSIEKLKELTGCK